MGELVDEADRVRDQHARPCCRDERADGGVQRREQLVGDVHLAAGERPHQRRLSRVGVADQRDPAHVPAARALRALLLGQRRQIAGQFGDAVADLPAVELQTGLARALASNAAALAVLAFALLAQARHQI